MASYDVGSNVCQALGYGLTRYALEVGLVAVGPGR